MHLYTFPWLSFHLNLCRSRCSSACTKLSLQIIESLSQLCNPCPPAHSERASFITANPLITPIPVPDRLFFNYCSQELPWKTLFTGPQTSICSRMLHLNEQSGSWNFLLLACVKSKCPHYLLWVSAGGGSGGQKTAKRQTNSTRK